VEGVGVPLGTVGRGDVLGDGVGGKTVGEGVFEGTQAEKQSKTRIETANKGPRVILDDLMKTMIPVFPLNFNHDLF
jgi:hypothetical protein